MYDEIRHEVRINEMQNMLIEQNDGHHHFSDEA